MWLVDNIGRGTNYNSSGLIASILEFVLNCGGHGCKAEGVGPGEGRRLVKSTHYTTVTRR